MVYDTEIFIYYFNKEYLYTIMLNVRFSELVFKFYLTINEAKCVVKQILWHISSKITLLYTVKII